MELNSTPTAPAPITISDFGTCGHSKHLDVGENTVVWLETEDHLRIGTCREDEILGFHFAFRAVRGRQLDSVHTVFRAAGKSAIAGDHRNLVLLHQKSETLGVLIDDGGLARLHSVPVERAAIDTVDAILRCVFQVIPQFGIEKQSLGGNAADMQAGAAQNIRRFDQRDFQSKLTRTNRRRITRRPAADNCHVIQNVCQENSVLARPLCHCAAHSIVQFNACS